MDTERKRARERERKKDKRRSEIEINAERAERFGGDQEGCFFARRVPERYFSPASNPCNESDKMSTMSVVSNSSVEVDSDSSNDVSCKDDHSAERKFILRNELYNSLLASALGKTVLNRHLNFKEQGINFNLANLKDNLNALGALKELKDLKGLTVSSVPAFPRNLALRREDHDEVRCSCVAEKFCILSFVAIVRCRIVVVAAYNRAFSERKKKNRKIARVCMRVFSSVSPRRIYKNGTRCTLQGERKMDAGP